MTKKLKNYTTKVSAIQSINEIQVALVTHGAAGILFEYEKETGKIAALKFRMVIKGQDMMFKMPVEWREFQAVLQQQEVKRADDDEYVYRVAWRILRDWIMAQMAIYEAKNVSIPQLLLGFGMYNESLTVYQAIQEKGLFLGSGK